jgi:trans-2,3-dihydro-3-hydroxyanthranilate isomerase
MGEARSPSRSSSAVLSCICAAERMHAAHRALAEFAPLSGAGPEPPAQGHLRYVLLDVFTDTPLEGNPLAVFPCRDRIDAERMQHLARELNLSESVFLHAGEADGRLSVRIFTPATELPFAGHPVLGCAAVASWALGRSTIELETGAGRVSVELEQRGDGLAFGRMYQPLPTWEPFGATAQLLEALGLEASGLPIDVYDNGPRHVYVEAADEPAVGALAPDLSIMAELGEVGVSCFAGAGSRWKTRMFAPGLGVAEDPATGSAAGPLAVHLARHGRIEFGQEIEIRQGQEIGRPALLYARAHGSAETLEAVEVAGSAVLVGEGVFALRSG